MGGTRELVLYLPLYPVDTEKRQPPVSQDENPHQELN